MGWTITRDATTRELPVVQGGVQGKDNRRRRIDYPLGATTAVITKGHALPQEFDLELLFWSAADAALVKSMLDTGACTIENPRGDTWSMEYDGVWEPEEAATAIDDEIVSIALHLIEVA